MQAAGGVPSLLADGLKNLSAEWMDAAPAKDPPPMHPASLPRSFLELYCKAFFKEVTELSGHAGTLPLPVETLLLSAR